MVAADAAETLGRLFNSMGKQTNGRLLIPPFPRSNPGRSNSFWAFRASWSNSDALVHVGLVGFLMPVDLTLTTVLLSAPLRRHLIKEGGVHAPVEFVEIHRANAFLKMVPFDT